MNLSWVALSKRTRLASLSLVFHELVLGSFVKENKVSKFVPGLSFGPFLLFFFASRWLGWLGFSSLCLLLWWHFSSINALPPDGLVGLAFPPFACCFGGIFLQLMPCLQMAWLAWLFLPLLVALVAFFFN